MAFLVVSAWGLLFTLVGLRSPRRPEALAPPTFFMAWLTAELPYHHLAWQAVATAGFIALGALRAWPGWVGLGLTALSWAGMVVLIRRARATPHHMEAALQAGLGERYRDAIGSECLAGIDRPIRWGAVAWPWPARDASVRVDRHITYTEAGAGRPQKLDVYRPVADPEPGAPRRPILLYIHGGAWIIGDKREQAIPLMRHLAAHGWVCVTANHRLSPKATFPDHLLDIKQALRWVREHGEEYGGDPSFVVVSGASAGGHLAALMALTAGMPEYQPGFEEVDTSVQGAVLWYGVYDLTNRVRAHGRGFVRFVERLVLKAKLADAPERFAAGSPMDLVHRDAPTTLIVQGSNDTLVPAAEAREFARLLAAASANPVVYAELPGAQHAFDVFASVRARHAVVGAARFCEWLWSQRASAGAVDGYDRAAAASDRAQR